MKRANASRLQGDVLPYGPDETKWLAVDPETDCRGVGDFETEAIVNLVYAVEAFTEDVEGTVPYLGTSSRQVIEMSWHEEDEDASGLYDRLQGLSPF